MTSPRARFPRALSAEALADLPPESYFVCVEKGTEPPFSGELPECAPDERYACVCCVAPLFDPADKYESGCGWPAFSAAIPGALLAEEDRSHGMIRAEILCADCGAHLGHVFPDGPPPSGLRYCVNAAALTKIRVR